MSHACKICGRSAFNSKGSIVHEIHCPARFDATPTDAPSTPWTPGPWRVVEWADEYGPAMQVMAGPLEPRKFEQRVTQMFRPGSADTELVALAPEMAKEIMRIADEARRYGERGGVLDAVFELDEKLRAIAKGDA